ncbi:MAG: homoserine dehydrogenase [Lachnospiraceae bacterium]|nr:homoserine dehydrogenase [Lachnospiraceae bacterium]MBO5145313.1 homoserine dehydrogenase [Lachnospiraceae bacterium]
MIKVAILGYGTVGSGVFEVIRKNKDAITGKLGDEVQVKYVLDLREFEGDPVQEVLVHDVDTILNDPEVAVVCETMGGERPAYDFTKRALESGKSVCTSNKELVEKHGPELLQIAKAHNCSYLFEASVGGGIPIIRPLRTSLAQEEILSITGILNGTTNYILTKMETEGLAFEDVLKRAQEKGYAEKNPDADILGFDACRKISILTSLAYGKNVDFHDITTEGITAITDSDFAYAKKMGATIKLFAKSVKKDNKYYAIVAPFIVKPENPLYAVKGVFNAILVNCNMGGETMYYGKGAGKLATASAVVADVLDCARHIGKHLDVKWEDEKLEISPIDGAVRRFFVRAASTDAAQIKELFGDVELFSDVVPDEIGFVTEEMSEAEYKEKAAKLGNVLSMIRVD